MAERTSKRSVAGVVLALVIITGALTVALLHAQQLPEGPAPVVWDRDACAHCRMHVGEPSFAAQLHTTNGEILHFDDPGCLFDYVRKNAPQVHATWFHSVRGEAWINGYEVRFERVETSPMGYGLGAVGSGAAGPQALDYAQAAALIAARKAGSGERAEDAAHDHGHGHDHGHDHDHGHGGH